LNSPTQHPFRFRKSSNSNRISPSPAKIAENSIEDLEGCSGSLEKLFTNNNVEKAEDSWSKVLCDVGSNLGEDHS
jgi:hypothetical protein